MNDITAIQRYGVGECEMIPKAHGSWMRVNDVLAILAYIVDHDDRDIMLEKITAIQSQLGE